MTLEEYICRGVSPYHVVATTKKWLKSEQFIELKLGEEWELDKGQGYFVSPYESVIFAFRPGDEDVRIATGHTDQPMLKLKPSPTIDREGNLLANVEAYGGMILNTWFDRPLSLAGKIALRSEEVFKPHIVLYDSKEPVAVIPSLAIHLNREVNSKNELKVQQHLLPVIGLTDHVEDDDLEEDLLLSYIADKLDVDIDDILDYDLFFYNPAEPSRVGINKEILLSPRLDNLTSCYSATKAMLDEDSSHTTVMALFDNEEIGSRSKQGAGSSLFLEFLTRAMNAMNACLITTDLTLDSLNKTGFMMSLDVAHAYHPNYRDKSDITTKTYLGDGIVLKTSGSQKYNSDARTNAIVMQLCDEYKIPFQRQINHSDIAGGSTLGPILSQFLPIPGVDIGVGVLAMHSAEETCAYRDCEALTDVVRAFLKE
ncbi:MAG: M18 family aminopeptidase [Lachnospiraceae bacterium]|nr:M18 family aminopeptidase [Lachnospiraceae bacterium]